MRDAGFETEWQEIVALTDSDQIAPQVKTLLSAAYAAARAEPPEIGQLVLNLDELLIFLSSSEGRTDANCWATDLFVTLADGWNWDHLPPALALIMGDMAGALHDTASYPDVAGKFGALPEQLLERLRRLDLPG